MDAVLYSPGPRKGPGRWNSNQRERKRDFRRRLGALLGVGLGLVAAAQLTPWRVGMVLGHSMEPTLRSGNPIVIDREYYRTRPLQPGDIVVARLDDQISVKRVYATGGTTFWAWTECVGGELRRTPIRPTDRMRFLNLLASRLRRITRGWLTRVQVPPGEVFLVGDSASSHDSRHLGPVATTDVMGRVLEVGGRHFGPLPSWTELSFPKKPRG